METQYQNQNGYQQQTRPAEPVSFKEWMIMMLISIIPFVNIIMLFVWAFGGNEKVSKSNYAKAMLLWTAIMIVLSILLWVLFIGAMVAGVGGLSQMSNY